MLRGGGIEAASPDVTVLSGLGLIRGPLSTHIAVAPYAARRGSELFPLFGATVDWTKVQLRDFEARRDPGLSGQAGAGILT